MQFPMKPVLVLGPVLKLEISAFCLKRNIEPRTPDTLPHQQRERAVFESLVSSFPPGFPSPATQLPELDPQKGPALPQDKPLPD